MLVNNELEGIGKENPGLIQGFIQALNSPTMRTPRNCTVNVVHDPVNNLAECISNIHLKMTA